MAQQHDETSLEQERQLRVLHAFQHVFNSPEGEIVLDYLMQQARVFQPVTDSNSPIASAFADGARSIVLEIMHRVTVDWRQAIQRMERH